MSRSDSRPIEAPRPPGERLSRATWRGIALTGIATLLLLLTMNGVAGCYLRRAPHNLGYWLVQQKWELLSTLDRPVDWLVLGDSGGGHAVDPAVLTRRLGGRAVNLGTVADCMLLGDLWMLEQYLARFGPPAGGVIIVHSYDMWSRTLPLSLLAQVPPEAWQGSSVQPRGARGVRSKVKLWIERNLPLVAQHRTLSRALRGRETNASYGTLDPDGLLVGVRANPEILAPQCLEHVERLDTAAGFRLGGENGAALAEIVAIAERNAVPLYFAAAPQYEGLAKHAVYREYVGEIAATLTAWSADHPVVQLVLARPLGFPASQMQNVNHVVGDAARTYTEELARAIDTARRQQLANRMPSAARRHGTP